MKMNDVFLFEQIKDYLLTYLPLQRACSDKTVKSYREVLNIFLNYLCEVQSVPLYKLIYKDISPEAVKNFIQWLSESRNCTNTTINHRLSVIHAFLKYVGQRNAEYMSVYTDILQVPFKKVAQKMIVKHFSESVLEKLLAEPNPKKKAQHRDLVFMIMLYDTAARDSELLDLHPADVVMNPKAPYVYLHGKGSKIRTVPIMEKTLNHYKSYIKRFQIDPNDRVNPLFYTVSHGECHKMSDDNVGRFINKYVSSAREKYPEIPENITPHTFRHSRAINLYRNGMPLPLISELLGHSNIETTLIYAYADTEMKRKAIAQAMNNNHPLYSTKAELGDNDDKFRSHYGLI